MLENLLAEDDWHVRAFALYSLAVRGEPQRNEWLVKEHEPRVIRTAVRSRYELDASRIRRGLETLKKSNNLDHKLLAAEIALATGESDVRELAKETISTVILRMDRIQGGVLSPRLSRITAGGDLRRHYRWRMWYRRNRGDLGLRPAFVVAGESAANPMSQICDLTPQEFAAMVDYMSELSERRVDLAICLDCTASMWNELADAQSGIDDLMLFAGDIVESLRVAIVAYRDRRNEFETKAWDFSSDLDTARTRLWQLNADEGGDRPEAVYDALKLAYTKLHWLPSSTMILVLVGDAPPHVGFGSQCVDFARRGSEKKLTTHVITCTDEEVEHFEKIAEAGGGRNVALEDDDSLIAEITGLTLGERFENEFDEFFEIYRMLCQ